MAHRDICIPFMVGGVHYEAVGFLNDGEEDVTIEEACRRAGERVVKTELDVYRIFYCQSGLPDELLEFKQLLTALPSDSEPKLDVMFFGQKSPTHGYDRLNMCFDEWGQTWPCDARALVLRRA